MSLDTTAVLLTPVVLRFHKKFASTPLAENPDFAPIFTLLNFS